MRRASLIPEIRGGVAEECIPATFGRADFFSGFFLLDQGLWPGPSEAAHDLLYPEKGEEQHRGYQDRVRDDSVAVFRGDAARVQKPEKGYRQEG